MAQLAENSTNIELDEQETLIYSSEYGTVKQGWEKKHCYLHITDKRVISVNQSGDTIERTDILAEDIARMEGGIKKQRYWAILVLSWLCVILFMLCSILVMGNMQMDVSSETVASLCFVGILILAVGLLLFLFIASKVFVLSIESKEVYTETLELGLSSIVSKKLTKAGLKVKVNVEEADKIISLIGKLMVAANEKEQ